MTERARLSRRAYATARDADKTTIRQQIEAGVIKLDADGMIDVERADAAWLPIRHGRRSARANGDASRQSAVARIKIARARLAIEEDKLEEERGRLVDRTEAGLSAARDAAYVLAALHAVPERKAGRLALLLGIEADRARAILDDFIGRCVSEAGPSIEAWKSVAQRTRDA